LVLLPRTLMVNWAWPWRLQSYFCFHHEGHRLYLLMVGLVVICPYAGWSSSSPTIIAQLLESGYWTLLTKLAAERGCRMVSPTDPHDSNLGFLDRIRYYFFQVAPQLYSRGWVDPVPDTLILRKYGSARNRTRTSGFVARISDHKTTNYENFFLTKMTKVNRIRETLFLVVLKQNLVL
jgi:hypothetical protein